jgi:cyclin-dependent kinase inhibitor 3
MMDRDAPPVRYRSAMATDQRPEVRTGERQPFEVAWVDIDTAPGNLGLAMAPGRNEADGDVVLWQRDLHADLRRLRHVHRCDVLVSLLSDDELAELGIGDLDDAVAVHGIEHHRLPVRDGAAPEPEQQADVLALIDRLRDRLLAGRTVVLHCRVGQGRSGMLGALLVASLWALPAEAIARVRRAQPRGVETVQQEHYVFDTAFAWFRHHVATRTSD